MKPSLLKRKTEALQERHETLHEKCKEITDVTIQIYEIFVLLKDMDSHMQKLQEKCTRQAKYIETLLKSKHATENLLHKANQEIVGLQGLIVDEEKEM